MALKLGEVAEEDATNEVLVGRHWSPPQNFVFHQYMAYLDHVADKNCMVEQDGTEVFVTLPL